MNSIINKRFTVNKPSPFGVIIFFGLMVTIIEYGLGIFNNNPVLTSLYVIQLSIIFIVSYAECVIRLGWLHLFSLLHFSTFVFMVSSEIFSLFNSDYLIRVFVSPSRITFSEPIVQHVALIFSAYIATCNLIFFLIYKGKRSEIDLDQICINKEGYLSTGQTLLIMGLPFSLYVNTFYLLHVNRAAEYLSGSRAAIGLPLWARILDTLTQVGFLLIVASKPTYKKFVQYTILYSVPMIPLLLYGERGTPLMVVMFFFWYRYRFYNKKVKFVYLALIGFSMIVLAYFIQQFRLGLSLSGSSVFKLFIDFFEGSSTTVKLTSFYVEYADNLPHKYPFFLDQAISGVFGLFGESYTGQSLHTLSGRSSLAHQLTYYVNPNYYLSGASMGTAWVTECYEFGLIGVMIGGAVLAKFCQLLDAHIIQSRYWSVFIFEFFSLIILSPRGNLLPSVYLILKYSAVIFVVMGAYDLLKRRKRF